MSKRISTSLLFIVVIAIVAMFAHTEVSARVCVLKIGGKCIIWSGGVEATLDATNLRGRMNQRKPLFLGFEIDPPPETSKIIGCLYCKDPASNVPQIKTNVTFSGELEDFVKITNAHIIQIFNDTAIVSARALLSENQLEAIKGPCPGSTEEEKKAIDFVPCNFQIRIALEQEIAGKRTELEEVKYDCSLPDCDTLEWDAVRNRPQQREYTCNEID